jgi:hypothetical protein
MEPLSQFHPFRAKSSWYEVYWFEPVPARSESPWRKRLGAATKALWSARLRANGVAGAQAGLGRLDERSA